MLEEDRETGLLKAAEQKSNQKSISAGKTGWCRHCGLQIQLSRLEVTSPSQLWRAKPPPVLLSVQRSGVQPERSFHSSQDQFLTRLSLNLASFLPEIDLAALMSPTHDCKQNIAHV